MYGWKIIPFQAVCLFLREHNGHGWWITSATPIHTKLYQPSSSQSSQGRMQAAAPRQASQVKSRAVEPHRIRSEVDDDQIHDQQSTNHIPGTTSRPRQLPPPLQLTDAADSTTPATKKEEQQTPGSVGPSDNNNSPPCLRICPPWAGMTPSNTR